NMKKIKGLRGEFLQNAKVRLITLSLMLLLMIVSFAQVSFSHPIVDTVKPIQKQNDKAYRELNLLDPYGDSYTFTNVIKWHITDRELFDQIKESLLKDPFNVKPDEYRIDDIYLFSAPATPDHVEPFHILLDGETLEKKKKKASGLGTF